MSRPRRRYREGPEAHRGARCATHRVGERVLGPSGRYPDDHGGTCADPRRPGPGAGRHVGDGGHRGPHRDRGRARGLGGVRREPHAARGLARRLLGRRLPRRDRGADPRLRDPHRCRPRHPQRPVLRGGVLRRAGLDAAAPRAGDLRLPGRVHGDRLLPVARRSWPGRSPAPTTSTSSTAGSGCSTGRGPARRSTPGCSR